MELIGQYILYIIMICAVIGAVAAIYDSESPLAKEFLSGLHSIGPIFIPVAGIMASLPYLSHFIQYGIGPFYAWMGADPAIAATTILASDMGGYQLAKLLASSDGVWIMALVVGFMSGATIIFSIPVGLAMLDKKDHKYMALGMMSGILSIPVGVIISCLLIWVTGVHVRPDVATGGDATQVIDLSLSVILPNIVPLVFFCALIAAGLRFFPNMMIAGFLIFGRVLYAAVTLILVASIIEIFTSFFSNRLGGWGFDPIFADEKDQLRAIELSGYISIMLCGAFPMVYMINHFLAKPMERLGAHLGLSSVGVAGLLATAANILAMFRLVADMPAKDKVLVIAFAVCAAFTFGDHLSFSANFQPTIILAVILGKLGGGAVAFWLAMRLSVPKALELERMRDDGVPNLTAQPV